MTNRILVSLLAASALFSGCGGGDGAPSVNIDRTDPMEVASAFFEAVDDGDLDSAIEYVLPEQAADFREAMSGGMPNLPSDYDVVVMAQGDQAEASLTGTSLEVDMIRVEGEWWISN
jgi:hypothetical protein